MCLSVVTDDDPDRRVQLFCRATIVGDAGPFEGETLAMARRMAERYEGETGLRYIDESARLAARPAPPRARARRVVGLARLARPLSFGPRPVTRPKEPTTVTFDPTAIRSQFPSLAVEVGGRPVAYFDGPGGTQVPQRVIDAIVAYYSEANANDGGAFVTSERSDARVADAHAAVADVYGAEPDEIKFGANMTSLTFHISRSIGATLSPGDQIVVTTLDHEANVSTWRAMAADRGVQRPDRRHPRRRDARSRRLRPGARDADPPRGGRIRIERARHDQPGRRHRRAEPTRPGHGRTSTRWPTRRTVRSMCKALDTEFLVSSPYKWYGPHAGALYGKREILESLPAYKVRPAHDHFETGTQNFEGIAGTAAAVEYLASLGDLAGVGGRRLTSGAAARRDGRRSGPTRRRSTGS